MWIRIKKLREKLNKVESKWRKEAGFYATPIILFILLILSIIGMGFLFLATTDIEQVKRDELANKALQAAEAGINNYIWHMNEDDDYYLTQTHPAEQDWVQTDEGRYKLKVTPLEIPGVILEATGEATGSTTSGEMTVRRKVKVRIQKKSFTRYIYFTDSETAEDGSLIWFVTGDVIHGPLHSNDRIRIDGDPVFEGKVTTHQDIYIASGNPTFMEGYEEWVDALEVPSSNTDLIYWARASLGGYYYYGRTEIELLPNGYLNITNSNPLSEGPTGIVPLPSSGVIYVDGSQSPGTAPDGWGYPGWNTYNNAKWNNNNGNVFVHGTLSGKLTIAASNHIYITGDITYQNPNDDMLGLIANNWIYVNHYDQSGNDVAPDSITINAALFALNHSFGFEAFRDGPVKDTLTIRGSIAQSSRGPIGTFSAWSGQRLSGYNKDYWYDERMLYDEPPHFLPPLNAGFEIVSWEEVAP
jgi:Tfp pilus assembly protein PilX